MILCPCVHGMRGIIGNSQENSPLRLEENFKQLIIHFGRYKIARDLGVRIHKVWKRGSIYQ
jgi:hypothetical protein